MSLPVQFSYPINTINYKHLFHECPVPMYLFDAESFEILEANTAALIQYGYVRKQFIGLSVLAIRPEQEVERFLQISKHLPAGYFDAGRWQHKKKSGEVFYVHVFSHSTEFNQKPAVLALAVDINMQVENERKLQQLAEQTQKQNDKMQYFAWLNSHKLRNQAANILGLTSLYNEEKADAELKITIIENIETCAKQLDQIIREIAKEMKKAATTGSS